jgi:hypothetical protein
MSKQSQEFNSAQDVTMQKTIDCSKLDAAGKTPYRSLANLSTNFLMPSLKALKDRLDKDSANPFTPDEKKSLEQELFSTLAKWATRDGATNNKFDVAGQRGIHQAYKAMISSMADKQDASERLEAHLKFVRQCAGLESIIDAQGRDESGVLDSGANAWDHNQAEKMVAVALLAMMKGNDPKDVKISLHGAIDAYMKACVKQSSLDIERDGVVIDIDGKLTHVHDPVLLTRENFPVFSNEQLQVLLVMSSQGKAGGVSTDMTEAMRKGEAEVHTKGLAPTATKMMCLQKRGNKVYLADSGSYSNAFDKNGEPRQLHERAVLPQSEVLQASVIADISALTGDCFIAGLGSALVDPKILIKGHKDFVDSLKIPDEICSIDGKAREWEEGIRLNLPFFLESRDIENALQITPIHTAKSTSDRREMDTESRAALLKEGGISDPSAQAAVIAVIKARKTDRSMNAALEQAALVLRDGIRDELKLKTLNVMAMLVCPDNEARIAFKNAAAMSRLYEDYLEKTVFKTELLDTIKAQRATLKTLKDQGQKNTLAKELAANEEKSLEVQPLDWMVLSDVQKQVLDIKSDGKPFSPEDRIKIAESMLLVAQADVTRNPMLSGSKIALLNSHLEQVKKEVAEKQQVAQQAAQREAETNTTAKNSEGRVDLFKRWLDESEPGRSAAEEDKKLYETYEEVAPLESIERGQAQYHLGSLMKIDELERATLDLAKSNVSSDQGEDAKNDLEALQLLIDKARQRNVVKLAKSVGFVENVGLDNRYDVIDTPPGQAPKGYKSELLKAYVMLNEPTQRGKLNNVLYPKNEETIKPPMAATDIASFSSQDSPAPGGSFAAPEIKAPPTLTPGEPGQWVSVTMDYSKASTEVARCAREGKGEHSPFHELDDLNTSVSMPAFRDLRAQLTSPDCTMEGLETFKKPLLEVLENFAYRQDASGAIHEAYQAYKKKPGNEKTKLAFIKACAIPSDTYPAEALAAQALLAIVDNKTPKEVKSAIEASIEVHTKNISTQGRVDAQRLRMMFQNENESVTNITERDISTIGGGDQTLYENFKPEYFTELTKEQMGFIKQLWHQNKFAGSQYMPFASVLLQNNSRISSDVSTDTTQCFIKHIKEDSFTKTYVIIRKQLHIMKMDDQTSPVIDENKPGEAVYDHIANHETIVDISALGGKEFTIGCASGAVPMRTVVTASPETMALFDIPKGMTDNGISDKDKDLFAAVADGAPKASDELMADRVTAAEERLAQIRPLYNDYLEKTLFKTELLQTMKEQRATLEAARKDSQASVADATLIKELAANEEKSLEVQPLDWMVLSNVQKQVLDIKSDGKPFSPEDRIKIAESMLLVAQADVTRNPMLSGSKIALLNSHLEQVKEDVKEKAVEAVQSPDPAATELQTRFQRFTAFCKSIVNSITYAISGRRPFEETLTNDAQTTVQAATADPVAIAKVTAPAVLLHAPALPTSLHPTHTPPVSQSNRKGTGPKR